MRSDGVNRRAAPNRSCSTRSGSAICPLGSRPRLARPRNRRRSCLRRRRDHRSRGGAAAQAVAADWESERPVPPAVIWSRTLDDACVMAGRALSHGDDVPPAHVLRRGAFGGLEPKSDAETPWDASAPVTIPDTGFNIAGYIDRLDIRATASAPRAGL